MTASAPQSSSSWKHALEQMLDDEADGAGEPALEEGPGPEIGLEFDLQLPILRRVRRAVPAAGAPYTLGIRPVRRGVRGTWIRGGLDWERVVDAGLTGAVSSEQADWFDELRVLADVRSRHMAHDRHWIQLEQYESPMLWSLLARAQELGIRLVGAEHGLPVTLDPPGRFQVDLVRDADQDLHLRPELVLDDAEGHVVPLTSAGVVGDPGHGLFFPVAPDDGPPGFSGSSPDLLGPDADLNAMPLRLVPLGTRLSKDQRRFLETAQELTVPQDEVQEFVDRWFPRLHQRITLTNDDGSIELPEVAAPEMVLSVEHDDLTVRLEWEWEYQLGRERVRLPFRPADPLGTEAVRRESTWETSMTTAVHRRIPDLEFRRSAYVGYDAVVLLRDWLPELEKIHDLRLETRGTEPAYRPSQEPPEITVSTAPSDRRDWFDLGITVRVGDHYVAFAEIFRALAQGQDIMMLPDGSWFGLDAPRFERLRALLKEARSLQDAPTENPMITRHQLGLWEEFEELADHSESVTQWQEAVVRLAERADTEPPPVPAGLRAELRPYQLEGYRWLSALHDLGLGGVLADDMGLGKTVQAIAMFQRIRELEQTARDAGETPSIRPFLVVAPTSVTPNWVSEIRRFAPELRVVSTPGTAASTGRTPRQLAQDHDVIVTSYALLRLDEQLWTQLEWSAVVLDEAQFVKNPRTRAHRAARALSSPTVLAVTGTPLENGLTDLWALLALTAPGLFPSRRRFAESYQRPIEVSGDRAALSRLRRRIAPFMLRRTKDAVDLQLPPKIEQSLEIQLSEEHRRLYDMHLQRERSKVLGLLQDLNGNRFTIFQSLTKLRLMALDPGLVDPQLEVSSSKLDALFERIPEILSEGHRPLVFSQFTGFLKLAAARLERMGIAFSYLDGSTRDRAKPLDDFRSGRTSIFLVSLKAGGTGLNLTEADYCFLLDPWWNPMAENQAVDRAHRIGQTRRVFVYRLIAQGTIEQKVLALKSRKAALFDSVMDDDGTFSTALTAEDVRELLAR